MNYFWDTFGKRIAVGFVFVASLLAVTVFMTVNQLNKIRKIDDRIAQLRVPTVETGQKLLESVNQSLMELRGWIILGEPEFKIQRRNIWSKSIAPSLFKLETLSKNWTNPENVVRFRRLQTVIGELETVQNEIEEIAQNLENMPAKQIFIRRASPLGEGIVGSLAQMIQQELAVAPAPRKEVLQTLSNIQQAFTVALSNIRDYLQNGEPEFETQFEKAWDETRNQITALQALKNRLTVQQRLEYENFQKNFLGFQVLPKRMLELRDNDDWNLAKAWLGGRVTPLVKEIRSTLQAMVDNQIDLRNDDLKLSQEAMEKMKAMGISLLIVMILIFPLLGIYVSQSITNPITELISASNSIASGNFSTEIELGSTREMRSLKNSLTKMQESLLFERTQLEQNDRLQDSFAKVMVDLQGWRQLREFSETFLSSLTPLVQGQVAALYLKEDEDLDDLTPTFTLQATYAHPKPDILQEQFKLGEGLVGQCAQQKEPLLVDQVPKDYLQLHSGLGHATPHNILLAPIVFEQKVLGVFEIGSLQEFTLLEQQLGRVNTNHIDDECEVYEGFEHEVEFFEA